jgi:hypothetical protein
MTPAARAAHRCGAEHAEASEDAMIVNRQKSTVAALPSTERWRHQINHSTPLKARKKDEAT